MCADLPNQIAIADNVDYGAFIKVTETALELDTIFQASSHSHSSRSQHCPSSSVPLSATINVTSTNAPNTHAIPTTPNPSVHPPKSSHHCMNCGIVGHIASTCFKSGGGMEGH